MRAFPSLSVITTVDREFRVLERFVTSCSSFSRSYPAKVELVVVEAHAELSPSQRQCLTTMSRSFRLTILSRCVATDQLSAIARGLGEAKGDAVIVMDPDMYANVVDLSSFIDRYRAGAEVVFGYRISRPGVTVLRKFMSHAFNWLAHHLSGLPIRDFNTSLILLSKPVVEAINKEPDLSGRFYVYRTFQDRITEVPVRLVESNKISNYSFTSLVKVGVHRLREVFSFAFHRLARRR